MEAKNVFGTKLRELRHLRGFSLQKLADRLTGVRDASDQDLRGVNKSYISDLERGTKPPPSRKQIGRFSDALRCDERERDELFLAAGFLPPSISPAIPLSELGAALSKLGVLGAPGATDAPFYGTTGGGPLPSRPQSSSQVLPAHDFTVRVVGDVAKDLYEEGDILLVKSVEDVANNVPVICKIGSDVLVRYYQRQARTVTLTPGDGEHSRLAAGRVKVLGQIVGIVRPA